MRARPLSCALILSSWLFLALVPAFAGIALAGPGDELRGLARAWRMAFGVALAALQQLEPQGAGDRRCLDQPHAYGIAQPVGLAAAVADHRVAILVIAEIFVADRARRDETV